MNPRAHLHAEIPFLDVSCHTLGRNISIISLQLLQVVTRRQNSAPGRSLWETFGGENFRVPPRPPPMTTPSTFAKETFCCCRVYVYSRSPFINVIFLVFCLRLLAARTIGSVHTTGRVSLREEHVRTNGSDKPRT